VNRVIDARELPEGTTIHTDVCVVGSGAAGLTLAGELAGASMDVCVVEAGGWEYEAATQDSYGGSNTGLPYFPLDANRQRSFGGTTNLWAGWCRPLDEIDFEERPWVADSGWPFGREELLPYYERAHRICRLDPLDYDLASWEGRLGVCSLPLPAERFVTRIFRLSPPACIRNLYGERVAAAANVRLLLHANALELRSDESGGSVSGLRVGCLSGRPLTVAARLYVLAAGGIENARLLLLSDAARSNGLGNGNDMVGRCFMEHPHFPSGVIDLDAPGALRPDLYHRARNGAVGRLLLPAVVQEKEELLNGSVMVEPTHAGDESRIATVLARAAEAVRRARLRHPVRRRAACIVGEPPGLVPRLGRSLRAFRLHHTLEQAPNRNSRVVLSAERDALGARRVRLEWRLTALEERTWVRSLELLDAAFREAGLGRLRDSASARVWPPAPLQGMRGHHMGTTRMSTDPRRGVVDAECRVHGVANLFIAGSSVFPTSGAGTPTLTIVALAIRLADRIKRMTRTED
jgi:choline dehydrogenase-like flavoprotein